MNEDVIDDGITRHQMLSAFVGLTFRVLLGFFIVVVAIYLFLNLKGKKHAMIYLRAWPAAVTAHGCR
jgi:hypothetical protein